MGKDDNLLEKMIQCENFVWIICVGGITIPLAGSIFVLEKTTHLLSVFGILTAIIPTVFAFASLISYHKAIIDKEEKEKRRKEKRGDVLLYIGGVSSILLLTVYVLLSGGIKDHLMAFFFVFIPSTTAVAFRTKKGLIMVSSLSIGCLIYLYSFHFDPNNMVEPDQIWYLAFSIWQIFLIILLEILTNKVPDKISEFKNEER